MYEWVKEEERPQWESCKFQPDSNPRQMDNLHHRDDHDDHDGDDDDSGGGGGGDDDWRYWWSK